MKIFMLVGSLLVINQAVTAPVQSNPLDSKRYNEVTQLVTHNSTSSKQEKLLLMIPNPTGDQNNSVQQQLQDGIRAFKVPVHIKDDQLWIAHTMAKKEFEKFLDDNIKL